MQRLSPCCVCSPAHTLATCASSAASLPAHTPRPWGRGCGVPSGSLSSHPSSPKGERGHPSNASFIALVPRFPSPGQEETAVLARGGVQDETTRGAGSGRWQPLCRARSGTQSNRRKAGTESGGSHYFGLGHFRSLAVLRVTQRLARSPVALHIPFLSMNEWSNLAGGHCKTQ